MDKPVGENICECLAKEHLHGIWALIQELFSMHAVRRDLWRTVHHELINCREIIFNSKRLSQIALLLAIR